jgi:hypothetical protein
LPIRKRHKRTTNSADTPSFSATLGPERAFFTPIRQLFASGDVSKGLLTSFKAQKAMTADAAMATVPEPLVSAK